MTEFFADLHIHSRFAYATSKKLSLHILAAWARLKGIAVLGTGDFTHPVWRGEMADLLVFEEESGLYSLKAPLLPQEGIPNLRLPDAAADPRFIIQGEISSIYKRDGKTRKVHNLVFMPSLEAANAFCTRLEAVGNLKADGRPTLGLDSEVLLEMVLETHDDAFLVPAHIWTPWFSIFGSKSGFDSLEECFGSLAPHVFALETGLSSDPAMNRLVSALDRLRLVSNSDAHSGENLGREANCFAGAVQYKGMLEALRSPEKARQTSFLGTLEFFPQEGKYHADGHRACSVRLSPVETRQCGGVCPVCGGQITVGVLHRVMELADREAPVYPDNTFAASLVPLNEVLGEILGVGAKSRKVQAKYCEVLERFGPELTVLRHTPVEDISRYFPPLGESISRMRQGQAHVASGYDGEYGVVRMFSAEELAEVQHGAGIVASKGKKAVVAGLSLLDEPIVVKKRKTSRAGGVTVQESAHQENIHAGCSSDDEDFVFSDESVDGPEDALVGNAFGRIIPKDAPATASPRSSQKKPGARASAPEETASNQDGLNPLQKEAVFAGPGPILVIAGPGTGKTRTLVARAVQLLEEGINPRSILAVTYTRKAASEMDARLRAALGAEIRLPTTDTLHAIALDIWHKTHGEVPILLSEESARLVFADACPDFGRKELDRAWKDIALARETLCPIPDEFASAASAYSAHKSSWNLADYTDLLEFWQEQIQGKLFKPHWDHVLVDEVQDLSPLQLGLVSGLVSQSGQGFFGIGDPDQSIYGFRGAKGQCAEYFSAVWPHLSCIALADNYRTCPEILTSALALLEQDTFGAGQAPEQAAEQTPEQGGAASSHAPAKTAKEEGAAASAVTRTPLVAVRKASGLIHLFQAPTDESECRWISDRITVLLGGSSHTYTDRGQRVPPMNLPQTNYSPGDIAVLVRTHALGTPVRNALSRIGIPVTEPELDAFWADPRVRLVLRTACRMLGIALAGDPEGESVPQCPDMVLAKGPLGMAAFLSTSPPFDILFWQSKAFRELVKAYDSLGGWAQLVTWLHLQDELELVRRRAEKVQVISLHASKGLEFPIVFMPCLEEGLLPHAGGLLSGRMDKGNLPNIEEERRLMYVGMTRAKDALFLSCAAKRRHFGSNLRLAPSRFLGALPKDAVTSSTLIAKNLLQEKQLNLL